MRGSPSTSVVHLCGRPLRRAAVAALALAVVGAARADSPPPGVALRIAWGGGKPAARAGRIELVDPGRGSAEIDYRLLSADPLAPSTMHGGNGAIEIHEPRGLDMNGVELRVADWRRATIRVRLARREAADDHVTFEGSVADILTAAVQQPLDRDGNRISIGRAPGDELRVAFAAGGSAVRRPGETVQLLVQPLLAEASATAAVCELNVRVRRSGDSAETHAQTVVVEDASSAAPGMREFRPVRLAVPLPPQEGGCDIVVELVERSPLRWSRAVAARTVQVVAVADEPPVVAAAAWEVVYELDPGSPKLLERLRRLPGMGLPSLPTAGVTLPKLPRPSFTLPKMPLPTPALPGVPVPKLPAVATMVPRLTGLLAVGHSTLESHDLGPMLRLPPASDGTAWEGIVLPGAAPATPHLVEVEYPLEQEMQLGLAVVEESGGETRVTATSGIDLVAPALDDGARHGRMGTRRFVFWPRTRTPLLVVTNLSGRTAAIFGKVRVLAGPAAVASGRSPRDTSRRTYVHLPVPDFTGFGAVDRADPQAGRAVADWDTFLGGMRRSADWTMAQGAAGALVGVYAGGAALWPSARTHGFPRWDTGGSFVGDRDPAPKDLLELLCRIYAREGLRLVPAVVCDGPVAELDRLLAAEGGAASGVATIGRDGRPLTTEGGRSPHYNILDPRVQAAVEGIVADLSDRVAAAAAVDGIAVLLSHDGWLHLPGVAAALDDQTFGRFVAAADRDVEPLARPALAAGDDRRFAARAALVEGPLRERWLAWREAEIAAFHGRLADIVAAARPTASLYVMPTTLFAAGGFSGRFRPSLAADSPDADVLREVGLDPARLTTHGRIVYVAPHVHAVGDACERDAVQGANRSLPLLRGAAQATRAGVVLLEQPREADLRAVAAQASFAAKLASRAAVVAPAGGAEARRALAEALLAVDAEVVFDAGLVHACVDEVDERCRRAFETLPAAPLDVVAGTPAPLVVRELQGEAGSWVSVVNASGTPCEAVLSMGGRPTATLDAAAEESLTMGVAGVVAVPLAPWQTRAILVEGGERVQAVRVDYAPEVARGVAATLADLQTRRSVLEMPAPLAVLDNPGFDLPELAALIPGWELVEPGRGTLRLVPGRPSAAGSGLAFSSEHGLATLRSNPFAAPETGRISIAMWIRDGGGAAPPLRIAIEGVLADREFYRFAAVGRGPGAMPVSGAWSQFVLQVDDLPTRGLESLRVRLDLLGPGAVEIDDVRVFDLAFDEAQRVRLSKLLAMAEQRLAAGDVGGCLVELDGPWPRFLRGHVGSAPAEVAGAAAVPAGRPATESGPASRSGVVDRVRRWWQ